MTKQHTIPAIDSQRMIGKEDIKSYIPEAGKQNKKKIIDAIYKHANNMNIKELEMVLRFMYSIEDFRK